MNITHNSCHKYIPNQLFRSADLQESQYDCKTRRFQGEQEESFSNQYRHQLNMQKTFSEKTNTIQNLQLTNDTKNPLLKSSISQKVSLSQSYQNEKQKQQNGGENPKKEIKRRDLKSKKKSSYKRKNLKKLFQDFEDSVEQDTNENISQKHTSSINLSERTNQKSILGSMTNGESYQHQKDKKLENSQCSQEISQPECSKSNKFNFLHNDLNLDSSSSDGEEQMKQSDSSENDFQKIALEIPKIDSQKKIFVKGTDLDLDSSDEEQISENKDLQEHKQKQESIKDSINQLKLNNFYSSDLQSGNRNLTIPEFRKEFTTLPEEYLKKSLPANTIINLIIKRDKSQTKSEFIEYYIYDSKLLKQIAVIIKKSSTYEIYAKTNVENPRAHTDLKYLTAILQSNFLGNEFKLKYVQHEFSQFKGSQDEIAASILYETNFLGFNGPRRMKIYIPKNSTVKYYGEKSLEELHQKMCSHRIDRYINRQAKWNNQVKSYVLNLKGKAKLSSVKNFVIMRDTKQEEFLNKNFVIFGKMDKDIFNLSLSGPFSILQAVSIAISSFERKITCQ